MAGREVDPELLGRLAGGLEESGRALKTIQHQQVQMSVQLSSIDTKVTGIESRIKQLEHKINGNGARGLNTEMELVKKDVEGVKEDLGTMEKWRERLGDNQIQNLQLDRKESSARRLQIVLAIGAMVIALLSAVNSCGPKFLKGWEAPHVGTN